jgi:ABC-type multidrug transport system fused ATPase/permease subunit
MRELTSYSYGQMIYFQSIPRIALDFLVVLSVFLIASFAIVTSDIRGALTQILIFLAAISRLAPSALRIQQAKLMAISSQSLAANFFELHKENLHPVVNAGIVSSHLDFKPLHIVFDNVSFKQRHSNKLVLDGANFSINQGDFVAIAGKSGAGKSTMCDLILGILDPINGKICINDIPSRDFIHANPGVISFVPQKVSLIHASFAENLTLSDDTFVSNEVLELVRKLNLEVFLSASNQVQMPINIPFQGSGGEIQRIGIGRALITNPRILILDEPTSSQDQINLDLFYEIINLLKAKNTTIIIAAHNLDIIKKADYVLYLNEESKVVKQDYKSLQSNFPSFVELTNKV